MKPPLEEMTVTELEKELVFTKECLEDEEETHSFHMLKTSAHIGAGKVSALHEDYENKVKEYRQKIKRIETLLAGKK